jgi:drug/metabolite transporter (DMT)-like permease
MICIVSVFHMVLFAVFMAIGLQHISVGRSVVLGYTTPLWVAPAAWLFLKEAMPLRKIAGIAIGLCGLAVLLNPFALDWNDTPALVGNGLLLIAAMSWAVAILSIKALAWHSTPYQLAPWQNGLAALLMIGLAWGIEGDLEVTPTWPLAIAMAYNALLSTAFGFWAITTVNRHFSATTTSLALLATPVVGIVSSLIMLGESIDLPLVIAGMMILLGIGMGVTAVGPRPRATGGLSIGGK